ncbi:MAG: amidohydrolase family protein [Deltaproteobacteria bacterium]|nr:amidohydrolase family protein [Deltaproteobacteria bacterium]
MSSWKTDGVVLKNARLIDGTGAGPRCVDVHVASGKIERILPHIDDADIPAVDLDGATVLPPLIDSHVHLESVPGSYYRDDSDEQLWTFRRQQLKAYPASGVTTVLDNGISARQLGEYQDYMQQGGVGPTIFALAPLFCPAGGYADALEMRMWGPFPTTATETEIDARYAEFEGFQNIIGVKVAIEPGMGPSKVWAVYDRKMLAAIAASAKKRGLPVHVHSLRQAEHQMALDMGAYRLVHAGFFHGEPTDAFLNEVKQKGVYVSSTVASTVGQNLVMFDLSKLDDPLLELVVPKELLKTARDPGAWKATMFKMIRVTSPKWMPDFIIRLMLKVMNLEKELTRQL